ncbi:hypothetical protein HGRIS_012924 [Hohenbuehelia grisea]|uniref:Uncharacterized protein n=1 Tax=Hohenbuehelia grisea TaxID=104357 RepID=A0ABR3ITV8_9AGAR
MNFLMNQSKCLMTDAKTVMILLNGSSSSIFLFLVGSLKQAGWGTREASEIGIRSTQQRPSRAWTMKASAWSLSNLCSVFSRKSRKAHAQTNILIQRFAIQSPFAHEFDHPTTIMHRILDATVHSSESLEATTAIPFNILSRTDILATVPEQVDIRSNTVPLLLRLRTKDLPEEDVERLHLTAVEVSIEQQEGIRSSPSADYLSAFPLPAPGQQPPLLPLRCPHEVSSMYDAGLVNSMLSLGSAASCSYSLHPPHVSGRQILAGNPLPNVPETDDGGDTWYTLQMSVPFSDSGRASKTGGFWPSSTTVQPTTISPLFSLEHRVRVCFAWSLRSSTDGDKTGMVSFAVPLRFTRRSAKAAAGLDTPAPYTPGTKAGQYRRIASGLKIFEPPSLSSLDPYSNAHTLPAYCQLFDPSGERRIDYSTPLPLYSEQAAAS